MPSKADGKCAITPEIRPGVTSARAKPSLAKSVALEVLQHCGRNGGYARGLGERSFVYYVDGSSALIAVSR